MEADRFYARFKVAFRLSYGFTYAAILLAPFSCFELHLIKSPSEPTHLFFSIYGFIIYGLLVVFLAWSLYAARKWKAELEESRADFKKQLLRRPLYTPRGDLRRSVTSWLSPRGPKTASPTSEPNASTTDGNSM